jgi:hypothetical protein
MRIIKSSNVRFAGLVASMGRVRNEYVLVRISGQRALILGISGLNIMLTRQSFSSA